MYDKFVATSFFHLQNCAKIKNVQNTPNEVFWTSMSKFKMSAPLLNFTPVVKSVAFNRGVFRPVELSAAGSLSG
jgi:hypothetical protein